MPSADMHASEIISAIERLDLGEIRLMEVCGTHTMSIAKSGLRSMLPKNIKLLSGPGCPVCVTPPEVIDAVLELAMEKDVIITTYGDMLEAEHQPPHTGKPEDEGQAGEHGHPHRVHNQDPGAGRVRRL